MLSPYGEIALRKIKSIDLNKKVILTLECHIRLVCIQRDWNQAELSYCHDRSSVLS